MKPSSSQPTDPPRLGGGTTQRSKKRDGDSCTRSPSASTLTWCNLRVPPYIYSCLYPQKYTTRFLSVNYHKVYNRVFTFSTCFTIKIIIRKNIHHFAMFHCEQTFWVNDCYCCVPLKEPGCLHSMGLVTTF